MINEDKRYDVILADPPWKFERQGFRLSIPEENIGRAKSPEKYYPTMSKDELLALPIESLSKDDSVLFLWTCWPHMEFAFELIRAWGFEYKTEAWSWVKAKKGGLGFHFGLGYYTRGNTEPCLLATRGSMPVARHDIQALIYSPVRQHSRKPDDQYRKIEALYPDKRYLELFARRKRAGWDAWGNEVESDIAMI